MRVFLKMRRIIVAAGMIGLALVLPAAPAGAVEYVKICEEFGNEFSYLPGTNACINPSTNDARETTTGGAWRWRFPNNPIQWIQAPKKICRGGRLIEFGTLDSSKLFTNAFNRTEATTTIPLSLGDREYISSVIYKGDLNSGAGADFCLFYHYVDVVDGSVYQPLGCANPSSYSRHAALLSFAPDIQPPDTTNPLFLVGASGKKWTQFPELIGGTLDIWLCIKKTKSGL